MLAVLSWSEMKVAQLCLTLCNPMDYTVLGILQARILEWVAVPFSRRSSQPRDQTQVSCIAGGFFTSWAIKGSPRILEWVAYLLSSRSFQPRNWTRVSCIASGFFTNWAIRETQIAGSKRLVILADIPWESENLERKNFNIRHENKIQSSVKS